MIDSAASGKSTPSRPVRAPLRYKHALHAFSIATLVGVQLAACAAGFLYGTAHLLGLPDFLLYGILGLTLLVSLALSVVLFVRTLRVEAVIERGGDAISVGWNPLEA